MANLILGALQGYAWEDLEPFIKSYQQTKWKNCDLGLFVSNIHGRTLRYLKAAGIKILTVDEDLAGEYIIDIRWKMYKRFLDRYGKDYCQVLLTDVADVILQKDLFSQYAGKNKFIGVAVERSSIANDIFTSRWIAERFGQNIYKQYQNFPVICCGTTWGTIPEIMRYSDKMSELILSFRRFWGSEQACANYIVYENLMPDVEFIKSQAGIDDVSTVGVMKKVSADDEFILNDDGSVPAVVHQYNRHQHLCDLVEQKYTNRSKWVKFMLRHEKTKKILRHWPL